MSEIQDVPSKDIPVDAEYFVALCDCPSQRARRERRRVRDRWRRNLRRIAFLVLFAAAVVFAFSAIRQASSDKSMVPTEVSPVVPPIPEDTFRLVFLPAAVASAEGEQPARNGRYINIEMTAEERDELAAVVFLEARNQSAEGQQAVVEVVLNRVLHSGFPGNIHDVLHEGENTACPQFSTVYGIENAQPAKEQYDAIDNALYGDLILPADVVFFSREGENDRVWGKIGDHVFCYEYIW